jgi:hypothetical protein
VLYIIVEIIFSQIKRFRKNKYILPYRDAPNPETSDFYLLFYQKIQYLHVARVFVLMILIWWYFARNNIYVFGGIWIAAWAIVISFSKQLVWLFNYLQILSEFKVGQTIKIDDFLWEIISIQPLEMKLSGKNERGEHNGYLYHIPMYQFSEKIIERVDVTPNAIQKSILKIPFQKHLYHLGLEEFLEKFEDYLKTLLPKMTYNNAVNYESYIGVRYKYNLEYLNDGTVMIFLWFLGSRQYIREKTKKIFIYLDSLQENDETVPSI